jgi:hypothetical protein
MPRGSLKKELTAAMKTHDNSRKRIIASLLSTTNRLRQIVIKNKAERTITTAPNATLEK